MKTTVRIASLMAAACIAATAASPVLAAGQPPPARPTATPAVKGKDKPIKLKPMSDTYPKVTALHTVVQLLLDGQLGADADQKTVKGMLAMDVLSAAPKTGFSMGGELLQPLLGSKLGTLKVNQIDVIQLAKGANYLNLMGEKDMCIKTKAPVPGMDKLVTLFTPTKITGVMDRASETDTLVGRLIGLETVYGVRANHFVLDAASVAGFNKGFASTSRLAGSGMGENFKQVDVWVAVKGGYLTKLTATGDGKLKDVLGNAFAGQYGVVMGFTDINNKNLIKLPKQCDKPIIQ